MVMAKETTSSLRLPFLLAILSLLPGLSSIAQGFSEIDFSFQGTGSYVDLLLAVIGISAFCVLLIALSLTLVSQPDILLMRKFGAIGFALAWFLFIAIFSSLGIFLIPVVFTPDFWLYGGVPMILLLTATLWVRSILRTSPISQA
jgi:hypothetical protein